ncbi:MAG: zinc-dependent alcohol dehydrogenase family protein [Rhodocyclaceae bacterium]|nr:zinc-dependent alcohol dehydrogenase family protein [Rhodocyclaceae bacterium]MBX3670028.1 zinc-dependent alcohol dehydrogenase family protein [Rhodocyclaceae bacterium]
MQLSERGAGLLPVELPLPAPGAGMVRLAISACGVCRTDLHVVDGELAGGTLPIIPGHEIVGRVDALGAGVHTLQPGQRVGVPWLGHTCGHCADCLRGEENLCGQARFTGHHIQGGYASHCLADARYCFPLAESADAAEQAPLLCAGLIGYRSWVIARQHSTAMRRIGIYGFGAAAHILAQVLAWEGRELYAFTRPGDTAAQQFALRHGALWAGACTDTAPQQLDAAILFAPVGSLVPAALAAVRKGGIVVCGGIHMSDIPSFPYSLLWGERCLRSVANLTRQDGVEFLDLAARIPVRTEIQRYPLEQANQALDDLRRGNLQGAAVLIP